MKDVEKSWKKIERSPYARKADDKEREILLLGDSLLGLPSKQFELEKMLAAEMEKREPGYHVLCNIYVKPGARVVSMRERIERSIAPRQEVKKTPPDGVIIYWDSDLVDVDNPNLPDVKSDYIRNLILLLKTAQGYMNFVGTYC